MKNPETYSSLSEELIAMRAADQELRLQWKDKMHDPEWQHAVGVVDEANTKRLKEIVDQQGWPTISDVGEEAASAAWILVQHADKDVDFQSHCLDLMKRLAAGELPQWQIAYLTDRVLLNKGGRQIFGTQFRRVDGGYEAYNLQNPYAVDERRAEFGLGSLAEATVAINKRWAD